MLNRILSGKGNYKYQKVLFQSAMDESLEKLREQVDVLTKKLEARAVDSEQFQAVQKELKDLREKYIFVLESLVKMQGNRNIPIEPSKPEPQTSLGNLQILMLLKESRATSREFAVTALQLKKAYSISKSERTVRNKLNYLEAHNLVASLGRKPRAYYLTPSGLAMVSSQARGSLNLSSKY